ncbi:MAG: hypothetical protein MJY97_09025 [Bacteroidales bacterium]|nr:hypothetical protein [Bacteroidales bacterium]
MNIFNKAGLAALAFAACFGVSSCIETDYRLGSSTVPTNQLFDTYYADIPIEDIELRMADSLSGYSNTRIAVGAIRDDEFGLTTRSSAVTLLPLLDTLDYGKDPVYKRFYFSVARDTTSVYQENQLHLLQNINVYEVEEVLDFTKTDINASIAHGNKRVSKGIPMVSGTTDSLSFNFTEEYGKRYMNIKQEDLKDLKTYLKKFPGIYLTSDAPKANGGRINLFKLQLSYSSSYNSVSGQYARLDFNSEYDGKRKDTTFLFYLCPQKIYRIDSLLSKTDISNGEKFPQYAYNVATHETRDRAIKAGKDITIEGGGGLKPVIPAEYLKRLMEEEVKKHTDKPEEVIVNRASITLPFEMPEEWSDLDFYPEYLNPTSRISYSEGVSYASLTDASSTSEEPGTINRSLLEYKADATYHLQHVLKAKELSKISNYDIWFLIMKKEITENEDDGSAMMDYMSAMSMASYYNNMYGYGGYGGYGMGYGGYGMGYGGYGMGYGGYGMGYGGYGYGYGSNYYNMAMYASMMSGSSTFSSVELDRDRFYKAKLIGPESDSERKPMFHFVYSIPRKD